MGDVACQRPPSPAKSHVITAEFVAQLRLYERKLPPGQAASAGIREGGWPLAIGPALDQLRVFRDRVATGGDGDIPVADYEGYVATLSRHLEGIGDIGQGTRAALLQTLTWTIPTDRDVAPAVAGTWDCKENNSCKYCCPCTEQTICCCSMCPVSAATVKKPVFLAQLDILACALRSLGPLLIAPPVREDRGDGAVTADAPVSTVEPSAPPPYDDDDVVRSQPRAGEAAYK